MANMTETSEILAMIQNHAAKCDAKRKAAAASRTAENEKALRDLQALSGKIKDVLDIANAAYAANITGIRIEGFEARMYNQYDPHFGLIKETSCGVSSYRRLGGGKHITISIDENGRPYEGQEQYINAHFVSEFEKGLTQLYKDLVSCVKWAVKNT